MIAVTKRQGIKIFFRASLFVFSFCAIFQFTLCAYANDANCSRDSLEGFNRAMFDFNQKVDTFILKPIATLYNKIIPKPLNAGIHNFFNNINTLPTIANDILQLHFYQMANDMWRLGINTTIGIGGLFDVASRMGLPYYSNDFGLTLAQYGWKNSRYLVLPFFGPNTFRDGIEIPVDYYAFSIYPGINPKQTRYALYGLGVVDRRAQLLKYQSVMEEAAVDKYSFVKNAYLQRRQHQIEENSHRCVADLYKPNANAVHDLPVQEEAKPTPTDNQKIA